MESPNPFSREAFLSPAAPPKDAKSVRVRRRRLSKKQGGFVTALGTAALVGAAYVASNLRSDRPGYPYPSAQNGLSLYAIHSTRDPIPDYLKQSGAYSANRWFPTLEITSPQDAAPFKVTARSSTGDTFFLDTGMQFPLPHGIFDFLVPRKQAVWFKLPRNGVPATYQWLDVTVQGRGSYLATWRVQGLPKLDHAVLPTATLRERQQVGMVSLDARAWWDSRSSKTTYLPYGYGYGTNQPSNEVRDEIHAEVIARVPTFTATGTGQQAQAWGVQIDSFTPEWAAPPLPGTSRSVDSFNSRRYGPLRGAGIAYANTTSTDAPAPEAQHIAQIKARLTRYDTAMETVTFRNLALQPYGNGWKISALNKNRVVKTPSGVLVRLDYSATSPPEADPYAPNDVCISYRLSVDDASPNYLSANDKNDRKNSRWRVGAEPTIKSSGFQSGKTIYKTYLYSDRLKEQSFATLHIKSAAPIHEAVLPTLTMQVFRQTAVQTIPITLTVPVEQVKAAKRWDNDAQ